MNLTVEIHEKEWPIIVAGAKKARTTPERYAQRLFNAGLDSRHPETWGNEPATDAQTLIALACAGLPDIARIAKAMRCPPERVERILASWDHFLCEQTGVPVEEAQEEEAIDPHREPEADETCATTQGGEGGDCQENSGGMGQADIKGVQIFESNPAAADDHFERMSADNARRSAQLAQLAAQFPPIGMEHTFPDENSSGYQTRIPLHSNLTEIPDSASSVAVEEVPAPSFVPIDEVPAPAAAPKPAPAVKAKGAAAKFDRFAALKTIADREGATRVLTDTEMAVFIAFAEAIEPRDRAESFPVTGKAKRALVEKEAEEAFEYLVPAFRAIQRAGLVILAAQAFSPAPYFGFTITPAGAAVILEALGYDD